MRDETTLHLVLTRHWFDQVLNGDKRVEYREMKTRWMKQIWDKCDTLKTVVFHRAYTSTVIRAEITGIDIGRCPYNGWDDNYYRIHFSVDGDSQEVK